MTDPKHEAYAPHPLSGIVEDLWGWSRPQTEPDAAFPASKAAPAFPPFDQLWQVADETVDWTEALVQAHPTDGLTSENLWRFFHEQAAAVLAGDTAAYVTVLKAANPLGDLKPYASSYTVRAESSDLLSCVFQAEPSYLEGKPETEQQRYLCGLSLRIARDLMALLPVSSVAVTARQGDAELLMVTYPRARLQSVRFGFVDPVALTGECKQ